MFSSIMQCGNFKGLTLWEFAYRQRQAHEEKIPAKLNAAKYDLRQKSEKENSCFPYQTL